MTFVGLKRFGKHNRIFSRTAVPLAGEGKGGMASHSHEHAHSHAHAAPPREAGFSLLRLSALQRIGLALVIVTLLWGGVLWALT